MQTYKVTYSARKEGAIGVFYPVDVAVEAESDTDAIEEAFDQLHRDGYETNRPIKAEKVEK
jgi:hypothetical protein